MELTTPKNPVPLELKERKVIARSTVSVTPTINSHNHVALRRPALISSDGFVNVAHWSM